MEQDKKQLLIEQTKKIQEIVATLTTNFNEEDVVDEINFLSIVKDNLEQWAKTK
jgi:hypothetical protein